jgi:hypothetical protein
MGIIALSEVRPGTIRKQGEAIATIENIAIQ